jgi:alkaline phosphatase
LVWDLSLHRPNTTTGSVRKDSRDLLAEAKKAGFNVFTNRTGFDALQGGRSAKLPYMGLFTASHMSYEIDRDPKVEPSLLEMTKTALETLKRATKNSKKGFFVVSLLSRSLLLYAYLRTNLITDDRGFREFVISVPFVNY